MHPLSVAVVNDCQLVVDGVAGMLRPYTDRVRVVELDCRLPVAAAVDIALYDAFAVDVQQTQLQPHLDNPRIGALVVYTWRLTDDEVHRMLGLGVRGVLAKNLDAPQLLAALEAIHAGETVVREADSLAGAQRPGNGDRDEADPESLTHPLPDHGLTAREAEVIALVALGLSNAEITRRLYITSNTLKSYIRTAYRKMGVERRTQAVTWALDHGLHPSTARTSLTERSAS